jgi:2-polyprenyl-3-methyl-5-hydroxy-6-metoxy-1,4-benzoquinol methylase
MTVDTAPKPPDGVRDTRLYFYDTIAESFDRIANPYDLQRRLEIVYDELLGDQDLRGKRLLDVGCGTGWFSQRAMARGARVVSLDIGQRLLHEVKAKCPSMLIAGDACALPIMSDSFDIVVACECIEHTLDPRAAVRELHRATKRGGRYVVTVPNRLYQLSASLAEAFKLRPYFGYEHWLGWRELRRLLRSLPATIETMIGFHIVPPLVRPTWPILRRIDRLGRVLGPVMWNIAVRARK